MANRLRVSFSQPPNFLAELPILNLFDFQLTREKMNEESRYATLKSRNMRTTLGRKYLPLEQKVLH